MHYGWVISESLREQLFRRADLEEQNYVKNSPLGEINEPITFEVALDSILDELDVSWSSDQYITVVLANTDDHYALFFSLYSNHDLQDLQIGRAHV